MLLPKEDISVKNVKSFYASLQNEIKKSEEILIDFSNIRRIDLSVVQVIIAAGREAKKLGKTIKLKSVSNEVKNQMHICGLKT